MTDRGPRRFLCDEMLKGLARWLRAAGHDAELAEDGSRDRDLLAAARHAGRLLLTHDRALADAAKGDEVLVLDQDGLDAAADELKRRLGLDWLHAPFTRCLVDNTPLRDADEEETAKIPEQSRAMPGPILACPACGRVYWPGSHVKRMRARLERWALGG